MKNRIRHSRFALGRYRSTALMVCIVSVRCFCGPDLAFGDQAASFARFVPKSAKLFLSTPHLGDLDLALTSAHAWDLLPILVGTVLGPEQGGVPKTVHRFLGFAPEIDSSEVERLSMAIVAPSKVDLEKAVWMIHLPSENALARWYPSEIRIGSGTDGKARFFLTSTGVLVSFREDVAAVARVWSTGSLFQRTMTLMSGERGDDSLGQSAVYRSLKAHLPRRSIASFYFAGRESATASNPIPSSVWPSIDRAMIGLYEGAGRLDVAIRAALASPQPMPRLGENAVDRLMRLPQTTLFASALTVDLKSEMEAAKSSRPKSTVARYIALLNALRRSDPTPAPDIQFGPHVIVAWGQDQREELETPQLAVMIESADEKGARQHARKIVERIIQLIRWMEPGRDLAPPKVEESHHLGVRIHHVPLAEYAANSELPFAKLLANTNPAWTVWGGWLVIALDRSHIERILDAQFGLRPTLASVGDMRPLRKQPTQRAALSILQADLVTQVLERWVADAEKGKPSLLDADWWARSGFGEPVDRSPFGIEIRTPGTEGAVTVSRAQPSSPAVGRVQPGDRILAVDGQVLSLVSASQDLKRLLRMSTSTPGPTVRIERGGKLQDVVLPRGAKEKARPTLQTNTTDAVRELASLGRTLQFSTFVVNASDSMHYSARLSLRFRAPRPVTQRED